MFLDPTLFIINIIGILTGIVFILLNIGVGKRIADFAFKKYFRWMTVGVFVFTVSFAVNFLELVAGQLLGETIHHLLILLGLFIFAIAGFNLLQEIKENQKPQ